MKKWLTILIILLLIAFACIYLFIPNKISLHQSAAIKVNSKIFYRTILEDKKWEQWWPGEMKTINGYTSFYFNGCTYTIIDKKINSVLLSVIDKPDSAIVGLNFIATSPDSVTISWEGQIETYTMPVKRMQQYLKVKKLKNDLKTLLEKLHTFYSSLDNIYGFHIQKGYVTDSILISTSDTSKGYPSTEFIYHLIDQLKKYIASQSAKETGFPMLNISSGDSVNFLTKVAIPVNKRLMPSGKISYRWMLGGGNILVTEVKGGPNNINKAFEEMGNYVTDFNRTAPAIPFQSLITNRRKEADTSKWITKVYWPVM